MATKVAPDNNGFLERKRARRKEFRQYENVLKTCSREAHLKYRESRLDYVTAFKKVARDIKAHDFYSAALHAAEAKAYATDAEDYAGDIILLSIHRRTLPQIRTFIETYAFGIPSYLRVKLINEISDWIDWEIKDGQWKS